MKMHLKNYTTSQKFLIFAGVCIFVIFLFLSASILVKENNPVLGNSSTTNLVVRLDSNETYRKDIKLGKLTEINKGSINLSTESYLITADSPFKFIINENSIEIVEGSFTIKTYEDLVKMKLKGEIIRILGNSEAEYDLLTEIISLKTGKILTQMESITDNENLKWRVDRFYKF